MSRLDKQKFSDLAIAYRSARSNLPGRIEAAFNDMFGYVKAIVDESEQSAIESLKYRDGTIENLAAKTQRENRAQQLAQQVQGLTLERNAAIEELADFKRQSKSDVRNHPEFLKMQDQLGKSNKALRRANELGSILEQRIELFEQELALYREE